MKRKSTLGLLSAILLTGNFTISGTTASARNLQEMQNEKSELQDQSGQLNGEIRTRESNMDQLQKEKNQLENKVVDIQMNIDELEGEISAQTETLKKLETEIERLQEEIAQLKQQIAQREEKLENQARAVQTQGNTTNMVNIIVASENLSDLVGRLGIVTHLVSANKDIMTAQVEDQLALEANEKKLEEDKTTAEAVKQELESNQQELVMQRKELDDSIMQVAELYQMNAEEKAAFVQEQKLVAEKTSALNREINAEQQRIAEEKAREEAARKAAEKKAREEAAAKKAAQEKARRIAAERKAAEEKAREEADRKAAAANQQGASKPASKPVQKPVQKPSAPSTSTSTGSKVYSSGMIRPVNGGYVTSRYGWRTHPIFQTKKLHAGTDIGGGGPIKAAKAGTVIRAGYNYGWGYYVKIDHGNGLATLYGHMQPNLRVSVGQHVTQGQQIGTMGSTGNSTGVHLHFEVYINGSTVDSAPYIGF